MTMMNVMWIANPYSKLRRIANPPQRITKEEDEL